MESTSSWHISSSLMSNCTEKIFMRLPSNNMNVCLSTTIAIYEIDGRRLNRRYREYVTYIYCGNPLRNRKMSMFYNDLNAREVTWVASIRHYSYFANLPKKWFHTKTPPPPHFGSLSTQPSPPPLRLTPPSPTSAQSLNPTRPSYALIFANVAIFSISLIYLKNDLTTDYFRTDCHCTSLGTTWNYHKKFSGYLIFRLLWWCSFLCVKSKSKKLSTISVARWFKQFYFWRVGAIFWVKIIVESTSLVFDVK